MIEKLIEIKELIEILGYVDEKSIKTWCKNNKVPLFHVGKKTYTISDFIDRFISQKLEEFVNANYKNPDEILKAIKEDNKSEVSKLIGAPLDKKVSEKFKDSKAADDFIKKIKAA